MSSGTSPLSSPTPTDTVIPFHLWDDLAHYRGLCFNLTLRFDEQLDPGKLQNALHRLLETGDWRKLGARLRMDPSGKLTYHLPSKFTEDRPGFTFTTEQHDGPIKSHPVASQMPSAFEQSEQTSKDSTPRNPGIRILDSMIKFHSLVRHKTAPASLEDRLENDIPQLAIHTILFNDATLLTITYHHTLMDAMGLSGFLHAWTAILSNREEVPPFLGFDEDIIESHIEDTPTQHILAPMILGRISVLMFLFICWWERFWYPKVADKVLVIPESYVREIQAQAMHELDTEQGGQFVSENDILVAWLSSLIVGAHHPSPNAPVQVSNVFDVRSVLGLASGVYIGNATVPACAGFQAREFGVQDTSRLSAVALRIRRALVNQRTEEQVFAYSALLKGAVQKTGFPPLIGHPAQLSVVCTNWQRAGFFGVDFRGARVGRGSGSCRPSYINVTGPGPLTADAPRNLVSVTGKDSLGNWWVQIIAREEVLRDIERACTE